MDAINRSLPVDIRLLPYDIAVNRAWARELQRIGVLQRNGTGSRLEAWMIFLINSTPTPSRPYRTMKTGIPGRTSADRIARRTSARIHTGRSRNDQVACDLRLFLMEHLPLWLSIGRAGCRVTRPRPPPSRYVAGRRNAPTAGQPITLGLFLTFACFGLKRDVQRLDDALGRIPPLSARRRRFSRIGFPESIFSVW
jgi:argininosuccinate lyase